MTDHCDINKHYLLELYFHEMNGREEKMIREHLEQCSHCRDYLDTLARMDQTLHQWQEASPPPSTLDSILEKIPAAAEEPAISKTAFPVTPFLKICVTIWVILGMIMFFQHKITRFFLWESLQDWWFVKLFGTLGVTLVVLFLLGAFITLALSPVLILDSQSRKSRYYFC